MRIILLSFGGVSLNFFLDSFLSLCEIFYRLVFGTPSLRIDLVDANLKFTPTIKSRALGPLSPLFSFPHQVKGGSFAQVKIIGPLGAYDYITRNDEVR